MYNILQELSSNIGNEAATATSEFEIENGVLKKYNLIQDLSSNIDDEAVTATIVFSGYHDEITHVMRYLGAREEETKISETISEFTTAGVENSQLKSALRKFPSLKVAMFIELWNRGMVMMAYSRSGYPFVTNWIEAGECDFHTESRWSWKHLPTEEHFKERDLYIQTGGIIRIDYHFPVKGDWEADNYVTDEVFESNETLTSITIPEGVTTIGDSAFSFCHSLTSITIPNSVTEIGGSAFQHCSSLTSIVLPNSVTSIGWWAFDGCSSLTSITIPDSVTEIGGSAFSGCSSLTSVTIPDGVTRIGLSMFEGCSSLTSVTIPDGVTRIDWSAFKDCSSLTSITIPEGVTNIGDGAFAGCKKLDTFTVKNQNCKLGKGVFGDAVPSELLPHIGKLFAHFSESDMKAYVLNEQVWNTLHIDVQAAIFTARQGKALIPLYTEHVRDSEALGKALLGRLPAKPSAKECKAMANFMTMFSASVTTELLTQICETLKPLKTAAKALEEIENTPVLRKLLKF